MYNLATLVFGHRLVKSNNVSSAIVIGNGESRRGTDLNIFKEKHTLVGCNAIHRDILVDYLVCCDRRMVEEAVANPNTSATNIYVRKDWFKFYRKTQKRKNIHIVPELPYQGKLKQDNPEHWGSGSYAVLLSAIQFKSVKIIGFDLYDTNNKINNIYKNTINYAKSDAKPVDHSFWVYQIAKVFRYYPDVEFIVYNKNDWQCPKEWQYPNVVIKNISQLSIDL